MLMSMTYIYTAVDSVAHTSAAYLLLHIHKLHLRTGILITHSRAGISNTMVPISKQNVDTTLLDKGII